MNQDACCAAVRRFLSKRIGEYLTLDDRPDLTVRNAPAVDEVWRSASHGYVVEHTRVEAFEAQIQDDIAFNRLVEPLQRQFVGALPGRFTAALPWGAASRAGVGLDEARGEIGRLIAERMGHLRDGETVVLRSDRLPYEVHLHKRHSNDSRIFFARWIEENKTQFTANDDHFVDNARAKRIGRALDQKITKLHAAAQAYGLPSILILESNDIALSNIFSVTAAFTRAMTERARVPDLVFLLETDVAPFYGWLMKDGDTLLPRENAFEDDGTVADKE